MKRNAIVLAFAIALLAPLAVAAPPASMVCALGRVTVCTLDGCQDGSIDALGVPGIIRLDFATGEMHAMTAADAGRKSTFKVIERTDERIVVQGFENNRAFSATIDADGIASVATSTDSKVVVMFGRCADVAMVTAK